MENMLNAREASELLGITEEKLTVLVECKVVPAYRVAGQFLRFKKEELAAVKEMLGASAAAWDGRVLNQAFNRVSGLEKFKELFWANAVYLLFFAVGVTIIFFIFFK
jgi:excisionase family DNA binding protein